MDVRQAHMPGNYESYDPSANKLGPPVCKICWEDFNTRESDSLNTVWVSFEGQRMIWYLCMNHMAGLKENRQAEVLKSVAGVVQSPVL